MSSERGAIIHFNFANDGIGSNRLSCNAIHVIYILTFFNAPTRRQESDYGFVNTNIRFLCQLACLVQEQKGLLYRGTRVCSSKRDATIENTVI